MTPNLLLRAALQSDVLAAYDHAEAALRAAERDAPELAGSIRAAVYSLFAARIALDKGRA